MTHEPVWIVLPPLGWLFWTLGGTYWKPFRRLGYPLVLAIGLLILGVVWWRVLVTAVSTGIVASLGYGEGKTWVWRILIGCWLGLTTWGIQGSWSIVGLVSGVFVLTFWLSRRSNAWPWKLSEGLTGLTHAIGCVWLATH